MSDPAHILVIDDEQIIRDGCTRILSKDGCTVVTAGNGTAGLTEIEGRTEPFDVVLLDLMMPGLSGMEVLERLRTRQPHTAVIVITGYATVESAVEAMKKGAYDFIAKPFTPDELRMVVRKALEYRALQKEAEFLRAEREKSLRDVATEKSKIKTIIHSMADGVLVCDRNGCMVLINPAGNRMLNTCDLSLLGHRLSQSNLPSALCQTIQDSLTGQEPALTSVSQELQLGECLALRAHTTPVRSDQGETIGSVTVLQDISALKELDRMKSEFIAMVAHELRAPIAAVEQQLAVILNKMAGEVTEKQNHLLSRAKERTQGLLTLINDLLDLSKIESGKMVQHKEQLVIQEVLQNVIDLMKTEAEKKAILVQYHPSPNRMVIHADRNSIDGVFTNLLSNAIKYTPDGGRISVTVTEEPGFAKTTVADTGIGIKEEDLLRIFDRFYRVKTKETRQIIGTGLGLSIVKSIVDAHLGSITVESREGEGSIFSVLLPLESPSPAAVVS